MEVHLDRRQEQQRPRQAIKEYANDEDAVFNQRLLSDNNDDVNRAGRKQKNEKRLEKP